MNLGLRDRRVLVTGGSGTIGRAIAIAFGAEGARVAATYRDNDVGARATAEAVETAGGTAATIELDLGRPKSVENVVAKAERELAGPIEVLVNNAVASMRKAGWGRIAFVSTGLVDDGFPGAAPYTTAKAGLHGLARTMSRELAGEAIYTNVVMAGFVPSSAMPAEVVEQGRRSAATGRLTTAEDVANVIAFLCSRANGNVTGEAIRADGHFLAITA